MIIDNSNRRSRHKTVAFVSTVSRRRNVISLVDKSFDDYLKIFTYVKNRYTLKLSMKCVDNTFVDISTGFVNGSKSNILKSIGYGLFAKKVLLKGSVIDYFIGSLRSKADYDLRTNKGEGGYGIILNKDCVLDCFKSANCKCSMSNCPLGVSVNVLRTIVMSNASMHIDVNRCGLVKLVADRTINANEEIFYDYESDYLYPAFD